MKRIYVFNNVAWNYRNKTEFPVCKQKKKIRQPSSAPEARKERSCQSYSASHIKKERSVRFTAQPLSALIWQVGRHYPSRHSRRWSTPVSTVLRKSATFFITNIFLIIKTLSRLESGQYPVWMTMKSRKGDFKEWKSKKFPGGARLRTPLEACAFGARLGNRSVFILDPRLHRQWKTYNFLSALSKWFVIFTAYNVHILNSE